MLLPAHTTEEREATRIPSAHSVWGCSQTCWRSQCTGTQFWPVLSPDEHILCVDQEQTAVSHVDALGSTHAAEGIVAWAGVTLLVWFLRALGNHALSLIAFTVLFVQDNRQKESLTLCYRWEICVFSPRLLLQIIFRNVSCNDFIIFNTQEESKEQSFSYAFIFPLYSLFSTSLNTSVLQAYSSRNLSYVAGLQIPHTTFSLFSQVRVKRKYIVIHNNLVRGLMFLFSFYCSKRYFQRVFF